MSKTRKYYEQLFDLYPDVLTLPEFRRILGGIGDGTARKLLRENQVQHFYIRDTYLIPKVCGLFNGLLISKGQILPILATLSTNISKMIKEAAIIEPGTQDYEKYEKNYIKYLELYQNLKGIMNK